MQKDFLSTSLCSNGEDFEGRARICFVQYTPSRTEESPPPGGPGRGRLSSRRSHGSFTHSRLSPRMN